METPKFKIGDKVTFSVIMSGIQYVLTGDVYIVDEYGTFEQNEEPSYDVMSVTLNGAECLYKHIRQSQLVKASKNADNGISEMSNNIKKFNIGDRVVIRQDLKEYVGRNLKNWTNKFAMVTPGMATLAGYVYTIKSCNMHGYRLYGCDANWPSEALKPATVEDVNELDPELKNHLRNALENRLGKISDLKFDYIISKNESIIYRERLYGPRTIYTFRPMTDDTTNLSELIEDLIEIQVDHPKAEVVMLCENSQPGLEVFEEVVESDDEFIDRIILDFDLSNESYVNYLESRLTNK